MIATLLLGLAVQSQIEVSATDKGWRENWVALDGIHLHVHDAKGPYDLWASPTGLLIADGPELILMIDTHETSPAYLGESLDLLESKPVTAEIEQDNCKSIHFPDRPDWEVWWRAKELPTPFFNTQEACEEFVIHPQHVDGGQS